MKKIKVGIDIDDVVVQFVKSYLRRYNQLFDKNVKVAEINTYDLWKPLKISRQESINLVLDFYDSPEFDDLELVEGVKDGLEKLSEEYLIYLITARHESTKDKTKKYFNSKFSENGYEILFAGDFFGENKSKAELCKEFDIKIMVEDNGAYAFDCASKGIKTFLLDKPWNKDYQKHENLIKVKNWKEIMEKLK